jgi:hypothetical protein
LLEDRGASPLEKHSTWKTESKMCRGGGNDTKQNEIINKQIKEEKKKMAKEVKLLLLGKNYTNCVCGTISLIIV